MPRTPMFIQIAIVHGSAFECYWIIVFYSDISSVLGEFLCLKCLLLFLDHVWCKNSVMESQIIGISRIKILGFPNQESYWSAILESTMI